MNGVFRNPFPALVVGKYCLVFVSGVFERQGKVLDAVLGDSPVYLVQWYDFIEGIPTYQTLVPLSTMLVDGWRFFDTQAEWEEAGGQLLVAMIDFTPADEQHA